MGRAALVTIFCIGLLALPSASAKLSGDPPAWTQGDTWTWKGHFTSTDPTTGGMNVDMVIVSEIAAPETVTAAGKTYTNAVHQVQHIYFWGNGTNAQFPISFSSVSDEDTWQTADAAQIKTVSKTTSTPPTFPGAPASGPTTSTTTTVYDPPCVEFQFPLADGKQWTSTCHSTTSTDGGTEHTSDSTQSFKVNGTKSVTVPAGTFETWQIVNATDPNGGTIAFASDACNFVRFDFTQPGETPGSQPMSIALELQSYKCADTGGRSVGTPTPTPTSSGTPPTGATPTGATPTGATPTGSTGGTTPATGATPTPTSTTKAGPGFEVVALAAGVVIAVLVLRRK